jgi:hypothetical protein
MREACCKEIGAIAEGKKYGIALRLAPHLSECAVRFLPEGIELIGFCARAFGIKEAYYFEML